MVNNRITLIKRLSSSGFLSKIGSSVLKQYFEILWNNLTQFTYFLPTGASVALWKDRYLTIVALSSAFSAHAGVIREAGVDDSTIRRRHGFQGNAPVGLGYSLRNLGGHFSQRCFPALPIILNVQDDTDTVQLPANNQVDQELQRLHCLPPAANY